MIVCTDFLNAMLVISLRRSEIITAAPVLSINLTIDNTSVFLNAAQKNVSNYNIVWKWNTPI